MTGDDLEGETRTDRIRDGLTRLRENGSAILVVGNVPTSVSQQACAAMTGTSSTDRVTVTTGGGCVVSEDGTDTPGSAAGTSEHVVEWQTGSRGATASVSSAADAPAGVTTGTVVESLPELADSVAEWIDVVARGASDDPGQLRTCVDSLVPLVEATSERSVFRLLHLMNVATRRARGIGHVHLPVARDTPLVQLFEPLFDVTVELRVFAGEPRQRWHLHDPAVTSDWLPIEEVV